ncbi:MAG: nucleotidyltransferase domain-containing protein [Anaerolineales bacterium]|nr:nucleotidyltransferase domain-containing protein [Anaerolineales bacterium]
MDTSKLSLFNADREKLQKHIVECLQNDARVVASWLFGSLGRGDADELSDIDIWVVVADEHIQDVVTHQQHFVSQVKQPVFYVEAPQNAPEAGGYLMAYYDMATGPHQVDWYWQPQSLAHIPPETVVLFDHVYLPHNNQPVEFPHREPVKEIVDSPLHFISYFWAMLLITAKYAIRKPQAEEMDLLPYVLYPFHKAQGILGETPATVQLPQRTAREKLAVLRRLADQMSALMPQIAASGSAIPAEAPAAAYKFLDLLEEVYL